MGRVNALPDARRAGRGQGRARKRCARRAEAPGGALGGFRRSAPGSSARPRPRRSTAALMRLARKPVELQADRRAVPVAGDAARATGVHRRAAFGAHDARRVAALCAGMAAAGLSAERGPAADRRGVAARPSPASPSAPWTMRGRIAGASASFVSSTSRRACRCSNICISPATIVSARSAFRLPPTNICRAGSGRCRRSPTPTPFTS